MLELGKAGALGVGRGVLPLLSGGAVVGTLQASNWKEQATAVIGDRVWQYSKRKGELRARWAVEPEDSARLRARQASSWKGTWVADLEGTRVDVEVLSYWKGTHRFVSGGQQVAHSASTGGWSPRPTLTATPGMPLGHQIFLLWLELVISRRNTAAMTAATGVAVVGGSS
ncbi:hypothetical protein SAMN05660662_2408 [Blastococcus aurantiacus]|uniref:Uncharacterized protein n=1 Tax=Blastococcus aurantiacus TaxID=1550231 RepID=A0A1G7LMN7_9ACTN|nr:hypothetical protein [Blastococcus aurantiacus]SDF50673.1 hypothetical protein SAMN05660662_2408 [Blastococcus aurantiacus]